MYFFKNNQFKAKISFQFLDSNIGESTDRIADDILQSIELLKQEVPSKTMVIILRVEYVIQKFDINFYNLYT